MALAFSNGVISRRSSATGIPIRFASMSIAGFTEFVFCAFVSQSAFSVGAALRFAANSDTASNTTVFSSI